MSNGYVNDDLFLLICGELHGRRREEVEEKMKADPGLAAEAQQLREALAAVKSLPEVTPSRSFNASLRSKLPRERAGRPRTVTKSGSQMWRLAELAGTAAAACLVAIVIWWALSGQGSTRSVYADLAEVVQNSHKAERVHMRGTAFGEELEVWFSVQPLRGLTRIGQRVFAVDLQTQTAYDPDTRTIRIQPTDEGAGQLAGVSDFFEATMQTINKAREGAGAKIAEQDQQVAGKALKVFTVTYEHGGQERFTVDPAARRVVRFESTKADGTPEAGYEIDYPHEAPADIYALGVPRDARVVDLSPPAGFKDLNRRVEAARDAFGPTYCATVYEASIRHGVHEFMGASVVYKKDGRYRIERYHVTGLEDGDESEQLWQRISEGDMAALEGWLKSRPVSEVEFYDGSWQTTASLDEEGKLKKRRGSIGRPGVGWRFPVEMNVWGRPSILVTGLLPYVGRTTRMLPPREADSGTLVGVEHVWQGYSMYGQIQNEPGSSSQYFNPARDYVCEISEFEKDTQADWQEDKNWLKDVKGSTRDQYHSERHHVLEYAQTSTGQWYAKKIRKQVCYSRSGAGRFEVIALIYVDTTREIPDELFDPASVNSSAIFQPKSANGSASQ